MTSAQPNPKDRTRPLELLALAGGLAVFVGLIVLMSTRDIITALIFTGIVFIVALVAIAMMVLAIRPDTDEKLDIDEQNRGGH